MTGRSRVAVFVLQLAMALGCAGVSPQAHGQSASGGDAMLQAIEREAMAHSRVRELAQALLDSIGPRLTGTPGMRAANDWAVATYRGWGIDARNEQYGSWEGWERGITHVDLIEPRVRSLNASLLAWSVGTGGSRTGAVVLLPQVDDRAGLQRWLDTARGKIVLLDAPEVTCRPIESWRQWGGAETVERLERARAAETAAWAGRLQGAGTSRQELAALLSAAGVAAVFTTHWSEGWGSGRIYNAPNRLTPFVHVGCEDYGLLFRLAQNDQGPVVRLQAEAEALGRVPVHNTIATLPGKELPGEYVVLSAHFDSWDGASGATDNGTGTVVMMEAMRILARVYPNPRRTIIAGHWNGEEQGIHGSAAFAADHPEIVEGTQIVLNQDTGTGRIESIHMEGFSEVEPVFRDWLARVPSELGGEIELVAPGVPSGGTSDHSSFVCRGAPAFFLRSRSWDYGTYTWHTDLDTFDKIAFDEVRENARLVAMLAYLASEHPERISRARAVEEWPECRIPQR